VDRSHHLQDQVFISFFTPFNDIFIL
jgi:hypothetical protein